MTAPRGERRPSTTPRYIAIAAQVRDRIIVEQLGPHTLLPSERELAEQHQVSRMTARQALSLLENEGVVYRRPPRGTFVAEPRVRFHIGSFSEEVSRLGRHPAARLLWAEHQEPTPSVRLALELDDGATVHVFHRLRTVDDVPFALETTFLPADLTPGILDLADEGSLWATLRDRYGIELTPFDGRAGVDRSRRLLQRSAQRPAGFGRHPADQDHVRRGRPTGGVRA